MRQSALITGASGFLGKYLLEELEQQFDVDTLSRNVSSTFVVDLSKIVPNLSKAYDFVVHAAGLAHIVDVAPKDHSAFFEINYNGTRRLCTAFDQLADYPRQFVFISTVAVYGLEEGEFINESAALNGHSPYALSKIQAEQFLQQWCDEHGVLLSILRLPLVAGFDAPGNLGAMVNAIRKNKYFTIDKGHVRKSIVLASDVAKWLPVLANCGGIYNLTDGVHPEMEKLAAVISKQLGKNSPMRIPYWLALPIAFAGDYLGDRSPLNSSRLRKLSATLTFDDSKARNAFGWKPLPVLEHFTVK